MRTMARCCYETLLSYRTVSCEGVQEDVGLAPHVEVFHRKIRIPGKSLADLPENSYYRPAAVQLCQRNLNDGQCGPIIAGDCYH
jgi:hypothetical protein